MNGRKEEKKNLQDKYFVCLYISPFFSLSFFFFFFGGGEGSRISLNIF